NREQKDMRDVDLPGTTQDACARQYEAAVAHRASVDEGRRVARYENEYFRGIAEAVVPNRDPAHDVLRNMVEKNQPQRQAAEQVEPQVALTRGRLGRGCRR